MKELTLIRRGGGAYIDSREVAELIGKRHNHLLRDISGYIKALEDSNQSNFGSVDFFHESTYLDGKGETRPCYLLTKMGCEMVANKLTGEKGVLFTAAYVAKFNEMEHCTLASPRLGEYNACARIVLRALQSIGATSEQMYRFVRSIYEPLGFAVESATNAVATTERKPMYTAKEIAERLGIFSGAGKPHAQAVSCIINENLFLGEEHCSAVTTDYGDHLSVSVRYDAFIVRAVEQWLIDYGYPEEIYGFERTYYVHYDEI